MRRRFAGGSMVRIVSFSGNVGSVSQHFLKKDASFRPAGGEMSFQKSNDGAIGEVERDHCILSPCFALWNGRMLEKTGAPLDGRGRPER
jgi:hypothetical protein